MPVSPNPTKRIVVEVSRKVLDSAGRQPVACVFLCSGILLNWRYYGSLSYEKKYTGQFANHDVMVSITTTVAL